MNAVKSFILGSASALVLAGGASAADLGVKKPSPVEYVKVCNTYGSGFFYIPGSNTCLKIGGRVRFEYEYGELKHQGFNAASTNGFRGQGHIQVDARTATEYGTLRSFVRLLMNSRTGFELSGSQPRYGTSTNATGPDFNGKAQTNVDFTAFIQFAGFTVGRTDSFFDYYTGDFNFIGTGNNGINTVTGATNLFAYTATFGTGFSATLSIEDGVLRRQIIASGRDNVTGINLPTTFGAGGNGLGGTQFGGTPNNGFISGGGSYYGGVQMPDIVGNVRYEGDWGTAQLSGAVHEIITSRISNAPTTISAVTGAAAVGANTITNGGAIGRDYGFAVQGGVTFKLPFFGADDTLVLQGAYGQGASGYTIGGGYNGTGSLLSGSVDNYNNTILVDGYAYRAANGAARVSQAETYTMFAGIQHYWTPTIKQSVFGSYGEVNYGRAAVPFAPVGVGGITNYVQWQVGSQVSWSPVKSLEIAFELQYNFLENNDRPANYGAAVFPLGVKRDSDALIALMRVQRDF